MSISLVSKVALVVSLVAIAQQVSLAGPAPESKRFDIDYAIKLFEDAMVDKKAISLQLYLDGFKEMMKFFDGFGPVRSFSKLLEMRIEMLQKHHDTVKVDGKVAYPTIQSAIDYERKADLLLHPNRLSCVPALHWLHRMTEFVSALMSKLSKLSYDDKISSAIREAYEDTLAEHQSWATRAIVSMSFTLSPHKEELIHNSFGHQEISVDEEVINEKMLRLANVIKNLYEVVDEFYQEVDIKNL